MIFQLSWFHTILLKLSNEVKQNKETSMNFWLKYYRRIKLLLFCIVYPIFKVLYCFDKLILKWANQPHIVPVQNLPFRSTACMSDSTGSTTTNLSTPFATRSITSFRMKTNQWKRWRISRRGSVLHLWEESTECVFNILFVLTPKDRRGFPMTLMCSS